MTLPPKHARFNKRRSPGTLKEATAALVDACGGVERVADLLSLKKTQVYRYTDEAAPDELKPSQIRLLETVCGKPIVTAFLAAEQKCLLIPVEPLGNERLDADMARVGEEMAQLFKSYAEMMADGKATERELATMQAKALRGARAAMAIFSDCQALRKEAS